MASIYKWLKECFNYYILGQVKEELITKINETNDITPAVKDDLMSSILLNKPQQLINQINDANNNIPETVKEDLMSSILKVHQPHESKPIVNDSIKQVLETLKNMSTENPTEVVRELTEVVLSELDEVTNEPTNVVNEPTVILIEKVENSITEKPVDTTYRIDPMIDQRQKDGHKFKSPPLRVIFPKSTKYQNKTRNILKMENKWNQHY